MGFQPGDLVRLKSGGSRMTVERVGKDSTYGEEAVFCVWQEFENKKHVVKRESFPPVVLEEADDESAGIIAVARTRPFG